MIAANVNNGGNNNGENIDENAPTIIDFLDASVMTLNKNLSEQERHQAADERAPLLPEADTIIRVARDPAVARARDTWFQEHRAASPGNGVGSGRSVGQITARLTATRRLICCGQCGGLVDFTRAAVAAAARDKGTCRLAATDGCSARSCTHRYRASERRTSQRRFAMDVLAGLRVITNRPKQLHERSTAVLSRATALDIADRTLAYLPATHSRLAAKAKRAGTSRRATRRG